MKPTLRIVNCFGALSRPLAAGVYVNTTFLYRVHVICIKVEVRVFSLTEDEISDISHGCGFILDFETYSIEFLAHSLGLVKKKRWSICMLVCSMNFDIIHVHPTHYLVRLLPPQYYLRFTQADLDGIVDIFQKVVPEEDFV